MSDPTFHRAPRFEQERLMSTPMTNTPSPTDDELIERLTRKTQRFPAMGGGSIGTDADGKVTSTSYVTDDGYRLVNPDGPAAADRLESVLADRARLEEALRTIASDDYEPLGESFTAAAAQIASAALNRSTDRAT